MATFQPRGPESPDDLVLCPQKELTRRVPLSPGVRAPATVQAASQGSAEEKDDEADAGGSLSFQPYSEPPPFLRRVHRLPGHAEAGGPWAPLVRVRGSPVWDSSGGSWASPVGSSPWDEAGSSASLAKKGPGPGPGGDRCQEHLPLPQFSEDSDSLKEPPKDDFSWTNWDSSLELHLDPGKPPVSLQTLIFWDSCSEEEEEEEEEGGRESEIENSSTGSCRAGSLPRTEVRGGMPGCYMAR